MVEPREEFFEAVLGTLGQTFDAAVVAVANPSREPERQGLPLGAVAKEDTLDATMNETMKLRHIHSPIRYYSVPRIRYNIFVMGWCGDEYSGYGARYGVDV